MARIKKIATELQVKDKLLDYSGDAGTSGQLLSSTGTGTNWITFTGTTGDVWNEDNRINIGGIGGDTQPGTNFVGDIANVFIYNADIGGQAVSNYTELVSRFIG